MALDALVVRPPICRCKTQAQTEDGPRRAPGLWLRVQGARTLALAQDSGLPALWHTSSWLLRSAQPMTPGQDLEPPWRSGFLCSPKGGIRDYLPRRAGCSERMPKPPPVQVLGPPGCKRVFIPAEDSSPCLGNAGRERQSIFADWK